MLAGKLLGFIWQVPIDRFNYSQMLFVHNLWVAISSNGHAEYAVSLCQAHQHFIAGYAHDLEVERPICGPHLFNLALVRQR